MILGRNVDSIRSACWTAATATGMLSISMKDNSNPQKFEVQSKDVKKPRRLYWFVDAKWVCSLLLTAAVAAWLLLMVLYRITAPSTGVPLTTNVLAYYFSRNGLDDTSGFDKLKTQIAASPTKSIRPIPGFPVTITEQDITTLSPRDLRLKIFGEIAKPLYEKGAKQYAMEITNDPVQQKQFENDAMLLSLVTQSRHDALGTLAVWAGVVALLIAAAAIFFSAGFGRLVTPGAVLLLVSLPGAVLFTALRAWSMQPEAASGVQSESYWSVLDSTKEALTPAFTSALAVYLTSIKVGVLLLGGALVGTIAMAVVHRGRKAVGPA